MKKEGKKSFSDKWEDLQMSLAKWDPILVNAIVAILIAAAVCLRQRIWDAHSFGEVRTIISNGFGISGGVLIGVGLIRLVSFFGLFDVMWYGIRIVAAAFSKDSEKREHMNYRNYSLDDYKREVEPRRIQLPVRGIIVGVVCMTISAAIIFF